MPWKEKRQKFIECYLLSLSGAGFSYSTLLHISLFNCFLYMIILLLLSSKHFHLYPTHMVTFVMFLCSPDLSYIIVLWPSMVFFGCVIYDIIYIAFMTRYHIILNVLLLFLLFLRLCHCTNSYTFPHMFTIAMPFYNWTLVVYINSKYYRESRVSYNHHQKFPKITFSCTSY